MAGNAPMYEFAPDKLRRGFGLDKVKPDLPFGGAASLIVHGGILLMTILAWQVTPPIMPEDVIAVDMVSDTPSVLGQNSAAETAQVGVDTATPAPLPQTQTPPLPQAEDLAQNPAQDSAQNLAQNLAEPQPPSPAQIEPLPLPTPKPASAPPLAAMPPPPIAPPPIAAQPKPAPRVPATKAAPAKLAPIPKAPTPAPRAVPNSAPRPTPNPAPNPAPRPAARTAQREAAPSAPIQFDLAAASSSASGADSGGRRSPQLAARGQAGRLGEAGGGAQLTGDLEAALRSQIQECWLEPANMAQAGQLLVVVSIDLGIDGRVLRDPILVSPSSRAGASPSLVVAIDNALRAVRDCAPFTLPPDRYESWRQVRFNFDPQRMARRR